MPAPATPTLDGLDLSIVPRVANQLVQLANQLGELKDQRIVNGSDWSATMPGLDVTYTERGEALEAGAAKLLEAHDDIRDEIDAHIERLRNQQ